MEKGNETIQDTTTTEQVDINLDDIFGVDAGSVLVPEEKKKSVFTKETVDTSFLNEPSDKSTESLDKTDEKESSDASSTTTESVDDIINEFDQLINDEESNEDKPKTGRPKTDKSALAELANKMIEEGTLIPFEDDKPLDEYTAADYRELFEANFKEREAQVKQEVPKEFFNSLPRELQVAAKYVADGGQDLKGLFKTLAQVEEVFDLDATNEDHQEEITRQYLYATSFGTPEEIEAEIEDLKDLNRLGKKAEQFKPKLDKMQEEIVARKLAEQEVYKQKQEEAAKAYTNNVYDTLVKGELGGIKLDKKTQSLLYAGLVQPNYPSISGKQTNLLGHLLEKYQFVEPRHDLIAEALWLLQDPDGYKAKLKTIGSTESVSETVRKLKTEEGRKTTASTNTSYDEAPRRANTQRTLQKPNKSIFSR